MERLPEFPDQPATEPARLRREGSPYPLGGRGLALLDTEPIAPPEMLGQMATVRLPRPDPGDRLFAEHRIEIPAGRSITDHLRISVAAYTTREEIDRLLSALAG